MSDTMTPEELARAIRDATEIAVDPQFGDSQHIARALLHYKARAEAAEADQRRYLELIYAVGHKYPGESRHETALRYIVRAESPGGGTAKAAGQEEDIIRRKDQKVIRSDTQTGEARDE